MQQQQLTQTDDWQTRLAERMASDEWKGSDPVLAEIGPESAALFLLKQVQEDRKPLQAYWVIQIPAYILVLLMMLYSVFSTDISRTQNRIIVIILTVIVLNNPLLSEKQKSAKKRAARLRDALISTLPVCRAPDLLEHLLKERPFAKGALQRTVDDSLVRILTPMSGEAVFALPFPLRAQLATLAEDPLTPQNLAIAILLALTSARDGNVQPVLRRLSKDARSARLREVAAECLREFSAEED